MMCIVIGILLGVAGIVGAMHYQDTRPDLYHACAGFALACFLPMLALMAGGVLFSAWLIFYSFFGG